LKEIGVGCTSCLLNKEKKGFTPNKINEDCEVAFLGTNGLTAFSQQDLFQGSEAIRLFEKAIYKVADPKDCSFLNLNLCITDKPDNWEPCRKHLIQSLKMMPRLKIIALVGADAYKLVTGKKVTFKDVFAKPFKHPDFPVELFPIYHPASAGHNPDMEPLIYNGIRQVFDYVSVKKKLIKPFKSVVVTKPEILHKILPYLIKQPILATDTEFTDLKIWLKEMLCISFSWEVRTGIGIPYKRWDAIQNKIVPFWQPPEMNLIKESIPKIFDGKQVVTHNGGAEWSTLKKEFKYDLVWTYDTMYRAHEIDCNYSKNLDSLVSRYIPENAGYKKDFWGDEIEDGWYKDKPIEQVVDYCNMDAANTFELAKIFEAINE